MIRQQFLIYITVGVVCALIDIGAMQGLIYLGYHYGLAASLGFALGLVVNYILHATLTFRAPSSMPTIIKFMVIVIGNYLVTMAFIFGSQRFLGGVLVGKVASLPVIAVNGFLFSKYWVFR